MIRPSRKVFTAATALTLSLGLAACGAGNEGSSDTGTSSAGASPASTAAAGTAWPWRARWRRNWWPRPAPSCLPARCGWAWWTGCSAASAPADS